MPDVTSFEAADRIMARYPREERSLIPIMQDVQAEIGYVAPEFLAHIADRLGIPEARAYSVASFYENFSFEPKGKFVVRVCDGTACHVRRSGPILERLRKELGLEQGKTTTPDKLFTVETVSCLGACGLAPAVTVDDRVHPQLTPEKITALVKQLRGESHET